MKIKVNLSKNTISIKNLSTVEFAVIEGLLSHVRLGQMYDGGASDVPFQFYEAMELAAEELEAMTLPVVSVCTMPSEEVESVSILISDPVIEVYAE